MALLELQAMLSKTLFPRVGEAWLKLESIRVLVKLIKLKEFILHKMASLRKGTSISCKTSSKSWPSKRNWITKKLNLSPIKRRRKEFSNNCETNTELEKMWKIDKINHLRFQKMRDQVAKSKKKILWIPHQFQRTSFSRSKKPSC